ncbi:hypothetical protein FNH09_45845 [Streptomyces adustus]|uniref:Uncharacterized protein n=1 Tax=Streptomyces adustus TaxID=1609272 RepID=A0A5N8VTZ6_9ACTN|nr:hypothetical protein [Streptomyces adustus]MPY38272.1 hypothetical protein [Streptomyces adustus]
MVQLPPVSLDVFDEARKEAYVILARVMARLARGEHVVRLGVTVDGMERPLSATLPLTVEGEGTADDLIGAEERYFENAAFLLACGLAQRLSYGVMYLRSPSGGVEGPAYVIRAWRLRWASLAECTAAEAAELIGDREPALFEDAFSLQDDEAIYPPVAYEIP